MSLSLALVSLYGMLLGSLLGKMEVPRLLGMLVTRILLGPFGLDLSDGSILRISGELWQTTLIITLMRAGLNLDVEDLRKVGRPAVLMYFVPACFEIVGMVLLVPALLGLIRLEAAVMGTVVVAMSPAAIMPGMLKLMEESHREERSISQMIMAGALVDDVSVIMLFTVFMGLEKNGDLSVSGLLAVPISIVLGLAGDVLVGLVFSVSFGKMYTRDSSKVVLMPSVALSLVTLEHSTSGVVGFSGLLAVMAIGVVLRRWKYDVSRRLSQKLSKLQVGAGIPLFVLVGAVVNTECTWKAGTMATALILGVLAFRIVGVFLCLAKTSLSRKGRVFPAMVYPPETTVQTAIGGLPLSMGLACGDIVLTVVVLSILITVLLGTALIDCNYKELSQKAGQILMVDNSRPES